MSKREAKRREQRAALIKHGWLCFGARGFERTQVIDIARSAGIAHGTLYRHFESKEALFKEVCRVMVDEVLSALKPSEDLELLTARTLSALGDAGFFTPSEVELARLQRGIESIAIPVLGEQRARLWRAMVLEVALEDDAKWTSIIANAFSVPAQQSPQGKLRAAGWR